MTSNITSCKECGARISFVLTAKQNYMPIDADSLTEADLALLEDSHSDKIITYQSKYHRSHFSTCSDPGRFRKRK